jgi:tetratricopeptide (TPR) repeat protein
VYLAAEHMTRERYDEAIPFLEEYLGRPADWPDQRAQVHHRLALCQLHAGDGRAAVETELASLAENASWPETAAGLAQAYAALERWDEVERWATRTLELGVPRSELPVNPAEFTFLPLMHLAEACFRQGRPDEGQEWLARAWAVRDDTA